jgi:PAS domain S-box-containing protein
MYGYDSKDQILQMQSILQLTDPEDREKVWGYYIRRIKGERVPSRYIHRSRTRDGRQIFVDNLVSVVNWEGQLAVQVTNLDVTQYVASQTVAQWERQAMLSEVSAGMAKRFVGHTSRLSSRLKQAFSYAYLDGHGQLVEHLRVMDGVLERMQLDLDSLLVAARDGAPVEVPINLSQVVAETITERLLPAKTRSLRGATTRLSIEDGNQIPAIIGDPLHLRQILNSILDNATEAMPQGGVIGVHVRPLTVKRSTSSVPKGRYALVEITDEGAGIDPEIAARLGEPFLSTKEGHAGLGISTTLSVMRRHRGFVTIQRIQPRGTRTALYFPIVRDVTQSGN